LPLDGGDLTVKVGIPPVAVFGGLFLLPLLWIVSLAGIGVLQQALGLALQGEATVPFAAAQVACCLAHQLIGLPQALGEIPGQRRRALVSAARQLGGGAGELFLQ